MIKTLKKLSTAIAIAAAVAFPVLAPTAAYAQVTSGQIQQNLCGGANLQVTSSSNCTETSDATTSVNNIITSVINILSIAVGAIAVIMIIIGGAKYILSGGDSGNVTGAKNTILFAIVGLVIVALAQIIVRFVLGKVTT